MLTYTDFLQIAEYANENWKGNFTEEEVKDNAKIYYADFQWSKENETIAETIKSLCSNLAEDVREMANAEEPVKWLGQIATELGLIDMDFEDYLETDMFLTIFM